MMTRKQFEKFRVEIEAQKFQSVEINPIAYGISRLVFEKEKLKTLIAAAEAIPMKTTTAKADRWKRKLKRADQSILRLQQADIHAAPLPVAATDRQNLKAVLNSSASGASLVARHNKLSVAAVRTA
jgi:UDP-N-acetylglucosamine enolpyruvyl transferase